MSLDYFLGIDPGGAGALAVLTRDGDLESVVDLPCFGSEPVAMDVMALLEAVGRADEIFVALEEPFAVAQNSSARAMTQGIGFGILLGVVGSMGLRHERIKPVSWKSELGLPMSSRLTTAQKKDNSRKHATRLWPAQAGEYWPLKKHDGRAEAALIGECARRRLLGSGG